MFPLSDRHKPRRYAISGAVEHVYRYLSGRQSEHLAIAWTQVAGELHGVPGAEVSRPEPADPHRDRETDPNPWPHPGRGAWPRLHRVLGYDSVRGCLGQGTDRPVRRGPKIAACKAVDLMVGPSWQACEDAHREATAPRRSAKGGSHRSRDGLAPAEARTLTIASPLIPPLPMVRYHHAYRESR